MIGISVGDIIKLLDQIPIWKTVSALPKQVKALEERVAVLEEQLKKPAPANDPCPLCGEPMKITKVSPHRTFGRLGIQNRQHTCSACGHNEERRHDPGTRAPSN
ncbi:ABC transporter C-terminal domain-containing protein [Methylobacterium aquaticum]|uniref:ABC transporter C-terminal domain-containing protein n=1 Tax=Methylobacterium aquaticum TaxID=270351 RepID=UPI003D169966